MPEQPPPLSDDERMSPEELRVAIEGSMETIEEIRECIRTIVTLAVQEAVQTAIEDVFSLPDNVIQIGEKRRRG